MNIFDDAFGLYWDDKNRYKLHDKKSRTRDLVLYMLDRTQQIFVWEGLPDTIPQHNLEYLLQCHGSACIADVTDIPEGRGNSGLYAMFGGLGGLPNAYYEPTIYTIANPYLEYNKELTIGVDCVWARNDKFTQGLLPMFIKYASMMNENEISMNMLSICYRIDNLISADDDRTFESAKKYFNDIISGQFGLISSSEFFDGIKNDATKSTSKNIKDLIEYEQYIKASWYNEIGLNSNYNMKRERMVASEAELTDDALIPLVDNMLSWRLLACEEIKEMYGDKYDLDNLTVKLNAVWDLDKMFVDIMPESDTQPEQIDTVDDALELSEQLDDVEDVEDVEDADAPEDDEPLPSEEVIDTAINIIDDVVDAVRDTEDKEDEDMEEVEDEETTD